MTTYSLDPNREITHAVLDLTLLPEEGQGCYSGSFDDCQNFIAEQSGGLVNTYTIISIKIYKLLGL